MKLWVDDERARPVNFDHRAKTYDSAIKLLKAYDFEEVSLDHDLGEERTGYDVLCWIEEQKFQGRLEHLKRVRCHSMNPVGRERIQKLVDKLFG